MNGIQFATLVSLIPLVRKGIMTKEEVRDYFEEINSEYHDQSNNYNHYLVFEKLLDK